MTLWGRALRLLVEDLKSSEGFLRTNSFILCSKGGIVRVPEYADLLGLLLVEADDDGWRLRRPP